MQHRVDPAVVRELLDYDADEGLLVWRARPVLDEGRWQVKTFNSRWAGKEAGRLCTTTGQVHISISQNGRTLRIGAHRLAWAHFYGVWPDHLIDHIDGRPTNNRIKNLRRADKSTNGMNRPAPANNSSGIKGVTKASGRNKWAAQIGVAGKVIPLGRFDTFEEAVAARREAERKYHGDFARAP